jgi:hypothetical protein
MGEWSPENTGGQWIDGFTGPTLGARFRGTNEHGDEKWSTVATVTTFDPPRRFTFDITYKTPLWNFKISQWRFVIEPNGDGCDVTESFIDRRGILVKLSSRSSGYDRTEFNKESMATTLRRLKEHLERS